MDAYQDPNDATRQPELWVWYELGSRQWVASPRPPIQDIHHSVLILYHLDLERKTIKHVRLPTPEGGG